MRQPADHAAAERAALEAAFATGRPFTGLRGFRPDPALDAVVPRRLARRLRAVPLTLEDGVLRVAVADPHADLTPLTARLGGGRRVEVTLAPATEIDEVLGPDRRPPMRLLAVAAALVVVLAIVLIAAGRDGAEKTTPTVADPARSPAKPAKPATQPPPPRPLTVAVTDRALPPALAGAWPSDAATHLSSSRADALAALCTGAADVAVLASPPSGAERADAGCALATAAEVTVDATVLRAPRGGCLRASRARTLAARARPRRDRRARPVAVRGDHGDCVRPTTADIDSGAYPLTHRVAIVTGPAGTPRALTPAPAVRPRVTTVTVRRLR